MSTAMKPVNHCTAEPENSEESPVFEPAGAPYVVIDPIHQHADGSIGKNKIRCIETDPKYTEIGTAAEGKYKVQATEESATVGDLFVKASLTVTVRIRDSQSKRITTLVAHEEIYWKMVHVGGGAYESKNKDPWAAGAPFPANDLVKIDVTGPIQAVQVPGGGDDDFIVHVMTYAESENGTPIIRTMNAWGDPGMGDKDIKKKSDLDMKAKYGSEVGEGGKRGGVGSVVYSKEVNHEKEALWIMQHEGEGDRHVAVVQPGGHAGKAILLGLPLKNSDHALSVLGRNVAQGEE